VERTGDVRTLRELWPSIEAALAWIDGPGDPDGTAFIEYLRATEQGLANQGGRIRTTRSSTPTGASRRDISRWRRCRATSLRQTCSGPLWRAARACGVADALDSQANRLAERFEGRFWCPEIGTYGALDGAKEPCRVEPPMSVRYCRRHCDAERAALVASGLMETRSIPAGYPHRGEG